MCLLCKNNFYIKNNVCTENAKPVTNCTRFSNKTAELCEVCAAGFFAGKVAKDCKTQRTPITNCLTYDIGENASTCNTCEAGFRRLNSTTCKQISLDDPNCLTADQDKANIECLTCKENYGLARKFDQTNAADYSCKQAPISMAGKCSKLDGVPNWLDLQCDTCQNNAIPMDLTGHAICVQRSNLERLTDFPAYNAITPYIPNCAIMSQLNADNAATVCIQCSNDNALKTDGTCGPLNTCLTRERIKIAGGKI